jgi:transposase-like protein
MKRRSWTPELKAKIVLEGLSGRPLAEICTQYEISQSQYYIWRDTFLSNAGKAFESRKAEHKEVVLKKQNTRLKQMVADLTLELKKNDEEWYR